MPRRSAPPERSLGSFVESTTLCLSYLEPCWYNQYASHLLRPPRAVWMTALSSVPRPISHPRKVAVKDPLQVRDSFVTFRSANLAVCERDAAQNPGPISQLRSDDVLIDVLAGNRGVKVAIQQRGGLGLNGSEQPG